MKQSMVLAIICVAVIAVVVVIAASRSLGPYVPPMSATLGLRAYSETYGWLEDVNLYRWDEVGLEWTFLRSVHFHGDVMQTISNMPLGTYKLRLQAILEVCEKEFTFEAGRTEVWDAVLVKP